jgi:hypothetical protein
MKPIEDSPLPAKSDKMGVSRVLPIGAFGLSLLIHAGVLLMVGGAVLIKGVIPRESFQELGYQVDGEEAMVLPEEMETVIDEPKADQLETASQAYSPSNENTSVQADIIIAEGVSSTMNFVPMLPNASPTGTALGGSSGMSSGSGSGSKGPGGKSIINLFGNKLESASLGVILDVSGSAHPLLMPVMKEIDKNYGKAPTLLVFGCGLAKEETLKKSKVTVPLFRDIPDLSAKGVNGNTTYGQIASAYSKKASGLPDYLDKLRKRNDVWYVEGLPRVSTQAAFEKLIDLKVDTIYWFADFQDSVDAVAAEEIAKRLKRNGIKVIIHDFTGKPTDPKKTTVAQITGGKAISQKVQ